jgi:hypothetical protein
VTTLKRSTLLVEALGPRKPDGVVRKNRLSSIEPGGNAARSKFSAFRQRSERVVFTSAPKPGYTFRSPTTVDCWNSGLRYIGGSGSEPDAVPTVL